MSFEKIFDNAVDAIPCEEIERLMQSGESLRIKLGLDPTAPDIHLGHAVVLEKLREFQDLGHTAVLIVGDYTARIGDPSGRSKTRPVLSDAEIESNTATYLDQAYLILDKDRTEVRHNSEWLAPLALADIIHLTRATTVARVMERDDFSKRYASREQISLTELLYPLMQAYDSVAIDADIELGGTDQLYNLLMGRQIMEYYGKRPQGVMTTPLLVGTDGTMKMSKSLGNYIGVTDPPNDMFGKAMKIPDTLMKDYYALLFDRPLPDGEPVEQKRDLARSLVNWFYDNTAVERAERIFDARSRRDVPEDIVEVPLPLFPQQTLFPGEDLYPRSDKIWIVDLITLAGFAGTNGEARRFVRGGAVRLDGEVVQDEKLSLERSSLEGRLLQVGKRRYARFSGPSGA